MALPAGQHDKLNYDVLALLFQFIDDRDTVLYLMRTCHFLYSMGISYLLARPIALDPIEQSWMSKTARKRRAGSFVDFILADCQYRSGCIREFQAQNDDGVLPNETFDKLLKVLRHASKLHTFSGGNGVDARDTAIMGALTENSSIKDLVLSPGKDVVDTLLSWHAPVETTRLVMIPMEENDGPPGHPYMDPTFILQPFAATLRKLTFVTAREFCLDSGIVFPLMKKLTVAGAFPPIEGVWKIVHAYPNLAHLSVLPQEGSHCPLHWAELYRSKNFQDNLGRCWHYFEIVKGAVEDVYVLGLPCKIGHLTLSINEYSLDDFEIYSIRSMLSAVLDAAKPLQLSFQQKKAFDIDERDNFQALLAAGNGAECLPSLLKNATLDIQDPSWMPGQCIDAYADIFAVLGPLSYVSLDITRNLAWRIDIKRSDETACIHTDSASEDMEQLPELFNFVLAFAVRIVQRISTLDKVEIKFRHKSRHIWEISSCEQGQKKLRYISSNNVTETWVRT